MELKSLLLGLFFSLGIFAVKSGVGMAGGMTGRAGGALPSGLVPSTGRSRRWLLFPPVYVAAYGALFALCYWLVVQVDLLRHLDAVQRFLQTGMLLHLVLAGLLFWSGASLLSRPDGKRGAPSRSWLLLALPCPLCFTVVLFSLALLQTLFPDKGWSTALLLLAGFLALGLAAGMVVAASPNLGVDPLIFQGRAMIFVAAYFCLTVLVAPYFDQVDEVYRLALRRAPVGVLQDDARLALALAAGCAFALGVARERRRGI